MSSPNMNLPIPVPSQTGGPQYAQDEVSCFNQIDSHNHTSGQGVQIPLDGLNVNQNLDMNNYSVTDLKSVQLNNSAVSPGSSSLFMLGNNLYFRDGTNSFNVQITNGAVVNVPGSAGIDGLPSGTASATFLPGTGTFRWESATNTGAITDIGPLKLRNPVAGSNAVTITPSNPTNNYTLTLPAALPASNSFLVSSSVGNLSFQATTFILPPGSLIMYGGTSAPAGWLFCDGSVVSTTTYAGLYSVLGSSYNIGNEILGTFRLPDLRSKTAMGSGLGDSDFLLSGTIVTSTTNLLLSSALSLDGMIQRGTQVLVSNIVGFTSLTPGVYYTCPLSPAFSLWGLTNIPQDAMTGTNLVNIGLVGQTGSFTVTVYGKNYQIGLRGGQNTVRLTEAQLPTHNHTGSTGSTAISFTSKTAGSIINTNPCFGNATNTPVTITLSGSDHTHSIPSVGSYSEINNVPQFVAVNYIIKY